jgi:nucleotide-binding universal stress UspA family protein
MTGPYTHILLPTDGSTVAEQAVAAGIGLARALGARVTAVHVIPDQAAPSLDNWAHEDPTFPRKLDRILEKRGAMFLETVREAALRAGVQCECRLERGASPHEGIIAAARDSDCDLIVMASHGEKGGDGTVLGSETVKAATLGPVPVLVHRQPPG